MKKHSGIYFFALICLFATSCNNQVQQNNTEVMNKEYDSLVKVFEGKIIPLYKEMTIAYWDASISGKDEDYKRSMDAEIAANQIMADSSMFASFKKIKESGLITDSIKKRELEMIYNGMLTKQIDSSLMKQMVELSNQIEKKFSTFRAEINGKKVTDNEIEDILSVSTDNKKLETAWVSVKKLGPVVAGDIIQLVKLRNEVAKSLGFNNYHEMKLTLDDQNPKEVEQLFLELDNLTSKSFATLKDEIDTYLANRLKIKKEELRPWHYQNRFFQEAPKIYNVDLDSYYKDKDIVAITKDYFGGINMDISSIIEKSDLFEKEGKMQHAYCTDIDNEGDVRVLCNVKSNQKWMGTMLHEYGHASYDKYIDPSLPFFLREPAHTFTTEAIAMIMGRLASNATWMQSMLKINDDEKQKIADESFKMLRLEQLVFSRWAQVMYNFEKKMYENPDQDLNKLWWDLVEKYQMMKRPEGRNEPDWATKTHIATSPCYYHNYLLGELLASQLNNYVVTNIIKGNDFKNPSYVNNKEIGNYFIEKVFKPGRKYYWNDMIEKATGEKLTAKYYAKQFVD
ncbi:MAG: M2 family metallopeptidase [Bacteroidia bacterium]|nr:M2 family metallopeptidase [Bacteroidia bacterium]